VITAIDTNVLLDVFAGARNFGPSSRQAIARCIGEGTVVACDVVWAEVAGSFRSPTAAATAMEQVRVSYSALGVDAALAAGAAWRSYRQSGGRRDRVLADFLIGAHASSTADRLLTRDRGFYRTYFKRLRVLDPTEAKG
jgi:hypothetical protein